MRGQIDRSVGTSGTIAAVAAAISAHFSKLTTLNFLNINALGGRLKVSFTQNLGQYRNIKLTGPAVFVFSGNFNTE